MILIKDLMVGFNLHSILENPISIYRVHVLLIPVKKLIYGSLAGSNTRKMKRKKKIGKERQQEVFSNYLPKKKSVFELSMS